MIINIVRFWTVWVGKISLKMMIRSTLKPEKSDKWILSSVMKFEGQIDRHDTSVGQRKRVVVAQ